MKADVLAEVTLALHNAQKFIERIADEPDTMQQRAQAKSIARQCDHALFAVMHEAADRAAKAEIHGNPVAGLRAAGGR